MMDCNNAYKGFEGLVGMTSANVEERVRCDNVREDIKILLLGDKNKVNVKRAGSRFDFLEFSSCSKLSCYYKEALDIVHDGSVLGKDYVDLLDGI